MVEILEVPITLICAAAPDVFRLRSISGNERLGMLYEYQIDLVSESHEVDIVGLLGQPLIIHVPLGNEQFRHFGGVLSAMRRGERQGDKTVYHATLSPEQELLNFSHDCRIFQDVTVVEVVQQIFADHRLRPCRKALFEKYRKWDYLTQYRESDWEFIRRILAAEGIYFYFDHLADGTQMVLADSVSSHEAREGWESVRIIKSSTGHRSVPDVLRWWQESSELATNGVTLRDFDFRLRGKSAVIDGQQETEDAKKKGSRNRYEYPGIFTRKENSLDADAEATRAEANRLANVRLEEKQSRLLRFEGEGTARNLQVGSLFSISSVPALADREFLIVATELTFKNPGFETRSTRTGDESHVHVTAIDGDRPFRMPRVEKPTIVGPQTARVVGGSDEEIWTDKYGRVRVQFHWDRKGKEDDSSACWVRVAHPWAGNHWGAINIPRVGNEVVVNFLDGDPDRPLITGSVYNADNMPPYDLPANKTQSGIKSRSTKGGDATNFNEIRFEDKKGKEELHMQAERDMSTHVKHDQTLAVDVNRTITVGADETTTVHGKRTTTVKKDDKKTIHGSETTTVDLNRALIITGESKTDVSKKATITFSADRETTVKGTDDTTVGKKVLKQGGTKLEYADGNVDLKTAGWLRITHAGAKVHIDDDGNVTIETDKELKLVSEGASATFADGKAEISAEKEATISVGTNTIKIDATGVTTSGNNITSSATGLHQMTAPLITQN
jgi:type VI secretion system secreted protein VgrG